MGRWACLLWVICIFGAAVPAAGQQLDEIVVGDWRGGARTDENGDYQLCGLGSPSSGATSMILYWQEYGLGLSLYNDGWELPEGGTYTVSAAIDGRWSLDVTGTAYSTTAIRFQFGHDVEAVSAFRLGNRLTIDAAEATFRFDLRGSNAAIGALQDCHARYMAARPGQAATVREGQRPETEYRGLDEPNVSLERLRSLFADNVSVPTKIIVPPDGLSHYVFFAPASPGDIRGSYSELEPRTSSTEEMLADHLKISELFCSGRFASDTEPPVAFGTSIMLRAIAICESGDSTLYESFTLLNLQAFAQLYLISSDEEGLAAASRIGDDLYGMSERFAFYLTRSE